MTHQREDGNTVDKDEARTPMSLFKKLNEIFRFDYDLCCNHENCLCRCGLFADDGVDMLTTNFSQLAARSIIGYCNPPYSNPTPFVAKAYEESRQGATVVMLLPSDTSTKVFHKYVMKASEIIFIEGRITFNNPNGTPMRGSPKFGSMVVIFDRKSFKGIPIISSMRWKE